MPTKIRIEHISEGYLEIWKSAAMQGVVDQAGERIAAEAGENFRYYPRMGNFTALGFVDSVGQAGAIEQQQFKSLSRAVHR